MIVGCGYMEYKEELFVDNDQGMLAKRFWHIDNNGNIVNPRGVYVLSDTDVLDLHQIDPDLAAKDCRLERLLLPEKPSDQELLNAEILLNQAEIIAKLNEQDEVQAQILLNQMGV